MQNIQETLKQLDTLEQIKATVFFSVRNEHRNGSEKNNNNL